MKILQSRRFILCCGQNKDGELGIGTQSETQGNIQSIIL